MKHLLFSIVLLAGCQAADNAGEMHEAMPAVPALSEYTPMAAQAWNADWAAGNAEGIGSQYTEDAIVYAPGADPIVGRAAITEFWAGALALSGGIVSTGSESDGTIGYETGTYSLDDSTGTHVDHGKYVVVWKYVNGEWKMYRDIWNTSMAAPEM